MSENRYAKKSDTAGPRVWVVLGSIIGAFAIGGGVVFFLNQAQDAKPAPAPSATVGVLDSAPAGSKAPSVVKPGTKPVATPLTEACDRAADPIRTLEAAQPYGLDLTADQLNILNASLAQMQQAGACTAAEYQLMQSQELLPWLSLTDPAGKK